MGKQFVFVDDSGDAGFKNSDTEQLFVDSRKDSLVQLTDIIAGAIARSYRDKTDAHKYLKLLKDKIITIDKIKP